MMQSSTSVGCPNKGTLLKYGSAPPSSLYAMCEIVWKDEKFIEPSPVTVKLSSDADDATDEKIFFYCDGIEDLKSLAVFGVEDFVITSCNYLTNEL